MKLRLASAWSAQPVTGLPPLMRRFLLIGIDAILLPLTVWLSFWLLVLTVRRPALTQVRYGIVAVFRR